AAVAHVFLRGVAAGHPRRGGGGVDGHLPGGALRGAVEAVDAALPHQHVMQQPAVGGLQVAGRLAQPAEAVAGGELGGDTAGRIRRHGAHRASLGGKRLRQSVSRQRAGGEDLPHALDADAVAPGDELVVVAALVFGVDLAVARLQLRAAAFAALGDVMAFAAPVGAQFLLHVLDESGGQLFAAVAKALQDVGDQVVGGYGDYQLVAKPPRLRLAPRETRAAADDGGSGDFSGPFFSTAAASIDSRASQSDLLRRCRRSSGWWAAA